MLTQALAFLIKALGYAVLAGIGIAVVAAAFAMIVMGILFSVDMYDERKKRY